MFRGCEIHVTTPLHHNVGIINPDTQRFTYTA